MDIPKGVDPLQAIYVADQHIIEEKYASAFPYLMAILMAPPHPFPSEVSKIEKNKLNYVIKRAARLFAEINGALPENDPARQKAAAVQLLVFSKVKPNEWLGTQGVAASMLGRESSAIGNVEMNYETGHPLLIQGDDFCVACHKVGCDTCCSQCKNVFYCSKDCQTNDWKIHKLVCATSRIMGVVMWNSTEPYEVQLREMRRVIEKSLTPSKK